MTDSYVLTTEDAKAWEAALPADSCVMGSLELMRIHEHQSGHAARLFVLEAEGARVAYPFFLRPVPQDGHGQGGWDTVTPEYTGPVLLPSGLANAGSPLRAAFPEAFSKFCRAEGIVAEFAHLNPWSNGLELLDPLGVEVNREIVYIDLTLDEETIWHRSLSSDTRRQTKQAFDAGVVVRPAESEKDVLAFHALHHQTMDRRLALERYYLPPEYFLAIFKSLPRNAFFMLSEYQGRIVAGGLYFQDQRDLYWHLSAVDMDFSKVRPVNAYHFESIKQGARAGKLRMLCGGAYQPGDGVFRFKAGFSPLRVPFKIYKRIHDPERYAALTSFWSGQHQGLLPEAGFFPAYRAGTPGDAARAG